MELTLNEMQALKVLASEALKDDSHVVCANDVPCAKNRWEILRLYLKNLKLGSEYINNRWGFNDEAQIKSLISRLDDCIESEQGRIKREENKQNLYMPLICPRFPPLCRRYVL